MLVKINILSERNVNLWLKICRVWSFLLYSATKLIKPGNYIRNFHVSLYSLYSAFKYVYTIVYASLELASFSFQFALKKDPKLKLFYFSLHTICTLADVQKI